MAFGGLAAVVAVILTWFFWPVSREDPEALNVSIIEIDLGETQDDVVRTLGPPTRASRNGKFVELIYDAGVVVLVDDEVTTVWGDTAYVNGHPLLRRGDSLLAVTKKLGQPDRKGYEQAPGEDQKIDLRVYRFQRKTLHVYSLDAVVTAFQLREND